MSIRSKNLFLFDLPPNKVAESLRNVIMSDLNQPVAHNIPAVYKNSMCLTKNQFVHQYPDGRKFLISQNRHNSEEKIIRQL